MTKQQVIDAILDNGTYLPDSGMIQRLQAALAKLSAADLADLKMVIDQKTAEATV